MASLVRPLTWTGVAEPHGENPDNSLPRDMPGKEPKKKNPKARVSRVGVDGTAIASPVPLSSSRTGKRIVHHGGG